MTGDGLSLGEPGERPRLGRERLPHRREAISLAIEWPPASERHVHVTAGFAPDGRILEVFLRSAGQLGSETDFLLDDVAVVLSRLLQHGDTVAAIGAGLGRVKGTYPASLVGAVIEALGSLGAEGRRPDLLASGLLRAPAGRAGQVLASYAAAVAGAERLLADAQGAYQAGDAAAVIEAANDAADILIEVARAMRLMLPAPAP